MKKEGGAGGFRAAGDHHPNHRAIRPRANGDLWISATTGCSAATATATDDVRRLNEMANAPCCSPPTRLISWTTDGLEPPDRNKDWSQSYGVTWDDSSQGGELYDGFIAAAVAEAITEDCGPGYCWHASRASDA